MSYQYHNRKAFKFVESVNGKRGVVSIEPVDDSIEVDHSVEGKIRIRVTGVLPMSSPPEKEGSQPEEGLQPEEGNGPFEAPAAPADTRSRKVKNGRRSQVTCL
jgi:hypothetical protein